MPDEPEKITILFLGANPKDTTKLSLGAEVREIQQRLRQSPHGARFKVVQEWAVHAKDLHDVLMRHRPQIVHFSGHGEGGGKAGRNLGIGVSIVKPSAGVKPGASTRKPGLVVEDASGNHAIVSVGAVADMFRLLGRGVRCVVLNACYSEELAKALQRHVDAVVGMSMAIYDESAIAFSCGFYEALGHGQSVGMAFELGKNQVDLEGLTGIDIPQLKARDGVDASMLLRMNERHPVPARKPAAPKDYLYLECDRTDAWKALTTAARSAGGHVLVLCGKGDAAHDKFVERVNKLVATALEQHGLAVEVMALGRSIFRLTDPDPALALVDALQVSREQVADTLEERLKNGSLILLYPTVQEQADADWARRHLTEALPKLIQKLKPSMWAGLVAVQPVRWLPSRWDWISPLSSHRRMHRLLHPLLLEDDGEGSRWIEGMQIWQAPLGRISQGHIDEVLTDAYAHDPKKREAATASAAQDKLAERSADEIFNWLEEQLRA